MAQAGALAAAGILCAVSVALCAAFAINSVFAGVLALDRKLCVINAGLIAGAAVFTLAGALAVAAVAGIRAGRIEPWEGVSAA
jgi:putative ABC transport system permease protein